MIQQGLTGIGEHIVVGMADLALSRDPNQVLCSVPLGACLGVAIYDPVAKVGGLLHSLLPDSSIDPRRAAARPGMFLDTGMAMLLKRAQILYAQQDRLLVYVAGGAKILDASSPFNIGQLNCDVLTAWLAHHGLWIRAQDVGGLTNRTMQLTIQTGEVRIKFSGESRTKLLCKPSTTI